MDKRFRNTIISMMTAVVLLASLPLTGCVFAGDSPMADGTDASSRKAPKRVVALSRSIGDLWLLAGGTLSGITSDGLDLSGITKDCVSVGTISAPNAEAIMELQPDEVLATEEIPAQKKVVETLTSAGISCRDGEQLHGL